MESCARQLWDFLRLGRPLFLGGGVIFHSLGITMALYNGATLNVPVLLVGQAAITAIQLFTHYSNEYFDLAADRANPTPTKWAGGSRVLVEGLLSPQVARLAAVVLALLALLPIFVLALVLDTGPLTIPLFLLALLLTWAYSAPPLQLHSRGLGELAVAVVVPGLTPLVGYYLQSGELTRLPLLAVFPLVCLQFAMILAINFPDAAGDAIIGKRTLVVRLGERAVALYTLTVAAAYLAQPLLVLLGLPVLVAVAVALSSPIATWRVWRMRQRLWADPAGWDGLGFWSVGLLMGTAVLELGAFGWLWWTL